MFIKFGAPISLKECVENFKRQLPPNTGNIVLSDKENQKQILNNLAYEVRHQCYSTNETNEKHYS